MSECVCIFVCAACAHVSESVCARVRPLVRTRTHVSLYVCAPMCVFFRQLNTHSDLSLVGGTEWLGSRRPACVPLYTEGLVSVLATFCLFTLALALPTTLSCGSVFGSPNNRYRITEGVMARTNIHGSPLTWYITSCFLSRCQ